MAAALAGEYCSICTDSQLVYLVFEACFTNSVTDEKEKWEVSFYSFAYFRSKFIDFGLYSVRVLWSCTSEKRGEEMCGTGRENVRYSKK